MADTFNDRIQKFGPLGQFIAAWGGFGFGNGQFFTPSGIAVDPGGSVYVTDSYSHRIQKFDSAGNFIAKWGSQGSGDGQLFYPYDVAAGLDGGVYVTDQYNHRIQEFDSAGNFVAKWGSQGAGDGQFYYPSGAAVESHGYVYVADVYNHRIQKFTPPSLRMDRLTVAQARIDFVAEPDADKLQFRGEFVLAPDASVSLTDNVTVQMGAYSWTISMAEMASGKKWEYRRPAGTAVGIKTLSLDWKGTSVSFDAQIDNAEIGDMSSWPNPVTVSLKIGNDKGEQALAMRKIANKWEYIK